MVKPGVEQARHSASGILVARRSRGKEEKTKMERGKETNLTEVEEIQDNSGRISWVRGRRVGEISGCSTGTGFDTTQHNTQRHNQRRYLRIGYLGGRGHGSV